MKGKQEGHKVGTLGKAHNKGMGRKEESFREPEKQGGSQGKEILLKLRKGESLRKKGGKISVQRYKYLLCYSSMSNAILDRRIEI